MPIIKTDSHPIINASLVDIFKLFILIIPVPGFRPLRAIPRLCFSCATDGLGQAMLAQGRCPSGDFEIQLTALSPLKAPILFPLGSSDAVSCNHCVRLPAGGPSRPPGEAQ
ncbi:hypothetical protein [Achromobacter denitrificans]|uniref:hypothetical protein n=1 Tax=Achromobacter denitrificans TaxID=32002 RepID=UPI001595BC16|nr:hypothetical protein [Achromobacter denitrificans]MBV2160091.1 hypothetical protein [Achromobacter denitrificans]MDX3877121.1 hypothetical protein [Achromobacter sp.]